MSKSTIKIIPNHPLKFSWFVAKKSRIWVFLAVGLTVTASALDTATYYVFKQLVDTAIAFDKGEVATTVVFFWVLMYPVTAVGHTLLYTFASLSAMKWITSARKYSADVLYEYLAEHSMPYFHDRFAGSLANKIWNASSGMNTVVHTILWEFLPLVVTFIGSVILLASADPILSGIFIFWVLLLVGFNRQMTKRTKVYSEERAKVKSRVTGLLVDIVTNIIAVKQFARSREEIEKVKEGTTDLRDATKRSWFWSDMLIMSNKIMVGLFSVNMILVSWWLWSGGKITIGEFIMVLTILNGIVGWISFIGKSMNNFAEGYGEMYEGLTEILIPHAITDEKEAISLEVKKGDIKFDEVTFAYDDNSVFTNFNLHILSGQRIGLVGSSGSGKSTFVSVLLRQYDLKEGEIRIDDVDIKKVSQGSLHRAIAVVPQEPNLFHRSLLDNIRYGRPEATKDEVIEAAKKAQAHEFIESLPEGYETLVGERGVKLSGGQRQRIAIARAILKNAPILVLDEATSALDSESEVAIQKALHELMEGKTVIAIAHRLSTLREMDRIVVLEGGAIIEDGTHDELKESTGTYAKLWSHQAGGFIE